MKTAELIDYLYMEKTALNAQKARAMAERAGLFPEGQWKWALRQLRDNRGRLLTGKEMAEAKLNLGAMNNNAYQKLKRLEAKEAYGTVPGKKDIPGTEFTGAIYTGKDKYHGTSFGVSTGPRGKNRGGDLKSVIKKIRDKDKSGASKHTFHTHPSTGRYYYVDYIKKIKKHDIARAEEAATKAHKKDDSLLSKIQHKMGTKTPLTAADYKEKLEQGYKRADRKYAINQKRFNGDLRNPYLVYPSGYSKKVKAGQVINMDDPKQFFKDLKSMVTDGDVGAFRLMSMYNKDSLNSIIAPSVDIQAIHKLRPQGMRSIYLDRTPKKAK